MRSFWIIQVVPKSCDQFSYKRMSEEEEANEDKDWSDAARNQEPPETEAGRILP